MPPATLAHGELMAFLSARATEFKPGGLFVMAFISRSEDESLSLTRSTLNRGPEGSVVPETLSGLPSTEPLASRPLVRERLSSSPAAPPATVKKRDIWDVMSGILGKAIQRLVSTQLLKPAVARQLLSALLLLAPFPPSRALCIDANRFCSSADPSSNAATSERGFARDATCLDGRIGRDCRLVSSRLAWT
jgi:hypothetical protein